jgi:hypothetical protein
LKNNPEDSVEFKRAAMIKQENDEQFARYDKDIKTPLTGRTIKARTNVEGFVRNMEWRKGMF